MLSCAPFMTDSHRARVTICLSTHTLCILFFMHMFWKKMTLNSKFFPVPPENDSLPIISPTELSTGISKNEDYVI